MPSMSILLAFFLASTIPAAGPGGCADIPNSDLVIQNGVVLTLGEIHGTVEAPRSVANLACLALGRGLATTVALELPQSDQAAVERFLASPGGPQDRDRLLELEFWSREYQDGRSSHAMFDLLEALREQKSLGNAVQVVLLDDPSVPTRRDRAMTDRLLAAVADPEGFLVSLTGNLHNRLTKGSQWDAAYEPMGYLLKRELTGRRLISLDLTHEGGSAWICTGSSSGDCGTIRLQGKVGPVGIQINPVSQAGPFSGYYHLGAVTASPPATHNAASAQRKSSGSPRRHR